MQGFIDLEFKRPGAAFRHRHLQHGTFFGADDPGFVAGIARIISTEIGGGQKGFRNDGGGEDAGFADPVPGELVLPDAGDEPEALVPAVSGPAEQAVVRGPVLFVGAVEIEALGAKRVGRRQRYLAHVKYPFRYSFAGSGGAFAQTLRFHPR